MDNRLSLIERVPKSRPVKALYRCSCGVEKVCYLDNVKRGKTKSCGCLRDEVSLGVLKANPKAFSNKSKITHGKTDSPEYSSWNAMIQRCTNPNRDNYSYYGGRGIGFDPKWDSFEAFYADMGDRPKSHTLERLNNDGDYSADNCVWATPASQSNNRRKRGTCV